MIKKAQTQAEQRYVKKEPNTPLQKAAKEV